MKKEYGQLYEKGDIVIFNYDNYTKIQLLIIDTPRLNLYTCLGVDLRWTGCENLVLSRYNSVLYSPIFQGTI